MALTTYSFLVPVHYPPTEPFDHGMLDVGDGQLMYWEDCGNRDGKPAVVLHGGPGTGCSPGMRRSFNPEAYRIVLFDQRGAGRSLPHACDPATDLSMNTTDHLVDDIERLREHLGIERWLVFGGSWGSTLALAYAERHPERVTEMVIAAVTMTRRSEIQWLYHGVGRFFPAEWARFQAGVPTGDRDGDLVDAYARLLAHPDDVIREQAARDWCDWEAAVVSLDSGGGPHPRFADARFRMAFARIVTHYFRHGAWLDEGQLLRDAHRLVGIPAVLIHGRLDLGGPLLTAWELAQAWPSSELIILDNAGHMSTELGDHVTAATNRFTDQ